MNLINQAHALLREFKGESYKLGGGVLSEAGSLAARAGKNAALIRGTFPGSDEQVSIIADSMKKAGVELAGILKGVRPNCPIEDLNRITNEIKDSEPEFIVSFGGGSTIDAVKAAEVLSTLGGEIEDYFGVGLVSEALHKSGTKLRPHIAIQSVASSAAHLTKYSNITDFSTGQKKLIVDEAIVPEFALFDYDLTHSQSKALTADGALDGLSHCLEVFYGAVGNPGYEKIKDVALIGIELVVKYLPRVMEKSTDREAREAIGLATDLGGYSIMLGGTNGAHLTSFSLVDILSHGRACAMLNPYYTIFFASAIAEPLRITGNIFKKYGYSSANFELLEGREAGVALADAMFGLASSIGFPTRLNEVEGFTDKHIERALAAAKNPQLKMKLQNMPVPLTAESIDEYMAPILEAAADGDLSQIKSFAL